MLAHTSSMCHLDIQGMSHISIFQKILTRSCEFAEVFSGLKVTDATLAFIGSFLSESLIVLDLRDCLSITPGGIVHVITCCTRLVELRMRSSHVDDTCIDAAACHLSQLRILDLQQCVGISLEGLRVLASDKAACKLSLRVLNLMDISLTCADIAWLKAALPLTNVGHIK